ncbi:MAG: ester cyclase [Candidatus Acidiferrum sp.]
MNAATASEPARPHPDAAMLIRRWFDEVWNKGMESTIEELFPATSVIWGVGRPEIAFKGSAEFKAFYQALRKACPDVHIQLEQVIQEDDTAFARWTCTATHTGEGLGIPPTNKKLRLCGMTACKVRDGKIVEGWNIWDQVGMARGLGVLEGHAAVLFS